MYVVFLDPIDYPGKHVVRRFYVHENGSVSCDTDPVCVCDTLAMARVFIPGDLTNLGRNPGDDPAIFEVWV